MVGLSVLDSPLVVQTAGVVGILAPAVGFFLVERRQALVGDGLGHVAFAGVAAGFAPAWPSFTWPRTVPTLTVPPS